jgi:hypothetical protein
MPDASFCFETLCTHPDREIPRLMNAVGIDSYDLSVIRPLIVEQKRKSHRYADASCLSSTKPIANGS